VELMPEAPPAVKLAGELAAGKRDVVEGLALPAPPSALRIDPFPSGASAFYVFNTRRGIFADPALRGKVADSVRRRELATAWRADASSRYLPDGIPGSSPQARLAPRVTRSRTTSARRTAVLYTIDAGTAPSEQAAILRDDLRKLGIDLTVKALQYTDFVKQVDAPDPDFDIALGPLYYPAVPDPADSLAPLGSAPSAETGVPNRSGFHDPATIRLMRSAFSLTGPARATAYKRVEQRLDALAPWIVFGQVLEGWSRGGDVGCITVEPLIGPDLATLCKTS
jgi:hypothetical protein